MRVLLFEPTLGGHHAEYAAHIARWLHGFGDQVLLATWEQGAHVDRLRSLPDSMEIVNLGEETPAAITTTARLWKRRRGLERAFQLADRLSADVLHHLYIDGAEVPWAMAPAPDRVRCKTFGTLFWLGLGRQRTSEGIHPSRRAYRSLRRRAFGHALRSGRLTGVFVHSERIKAGLMALYGDRFNDRIRVVPDPTVAVETEIPREEARRILGLPLGKPMILFFGGLRPDKGPDIFIEALSFVPGHWFAVIAGEPLGIAPSSVQYLRSMLPEPDRLITRLGFVREEEVMHYFLAADVVVLPYRRTFGGTSGILQRAAAAARPVIVADVGDVGPTVETFGLGLIVPPESPQELAQAMQLFLKDREQLTNEIRPRALLYAERHDWRAMATGVREGYLTMKAEPGRL